MAAILHEIIYSICLVYYSKHAMLGLKVSQETLGSVQLFHLYWELTCAGTLKSNHLLFTVSSRFCQPPYNSSLRNDARKACLSLCVSKPPRWCAIFIFITDMDTLLTIKNGNDNKHICPTTVISQLV